MPCTVQSVPMYVPYWVGTGEQAGSLANPTRGIDRYALCTVTSTVPRLELVL